MSNWKVPTRTRTCTGNQLPNRKHPFGFGGLLLASSEERKHSVNGTFLGFFKLRRARPSERAHARTSRDRQSAALVVLYREWQRKPKEQLKLKNRFAGEAAGTMEPQGILLCVVHCKRRAAGASPLVQTIVAR